MTHQLKIGMIVATVFFAAVNLFTVGTNEPMAAQSQDKPTEKKSKKKADRWLLLGRDGHCSPLKTLKERFPDIPAFTTPQALEQYLKAHEGTPLIYPINDPKLPELKGYSLFDPAHHISYIILPAEHCKGQFMPQDQDPASP